MAEKKKRVLKKESCKNHPDRNTSRRCFQCKAYICSQCQINFDHHLFCSQGCISIYSGKTKMETLPHSKSISVFSKKDIFYISAIIALIFIVIVRTGNQSTVKQPLLTDSIQTGKIVPDWQPVVYQKELNLEISPVIPESLVVSVWINNRYLRTIENAGQIQIPVEVLLPGENVISLLIQSSTGSKLIFHETISVNPLPHKHLDYVRIPGKYKKIALTFDGGSNNKAVDSILNIIKKYQVPATAFLTGEFIRQFPEDVKNIVNSGYFVVGNHSYSHPRLTTYASNHQHTTLDHVNFNKIKSELIKTDSLYYQLTGAHLAKFWRAPYGEYNREILAWAGHLGYTHLGWSRGFDTFDWVKDTSSSIYYTPEQMWGKWQIRWQKEPQRFRGAIVLMHFGNDRIKPMYKFLHKLIPFMKNQGYTFVNARELQ